MAKTKRTPFGRASFPALFRPESFEGSEPKYAVTLLFPPEADLSEMKKVASDAAKAKWGEQIPKNLRSPFRDCSEKTLDGYKDGWTFIRFSSKSRPAVVDAKVEEITEESGRFYPGCWCRVSYTVFAYEAKGNKGVSFGLTNVQKVGDDEPFGFSSDPTEDFEPIEDDLASLGLDEPTSSTPF